MNAAEWHLTMWWQNKCHQFCQMFVFGKDGLHSFQRQTFDKIRWRRQDAYKFNVKTPLRMSALRYVKLVKLVAMVDQLILILLVYTLTLCSVGAGNAAWMKDNCSFHSSSGKTWPRELLASHSSIILYIESTPVRRIWWQFYCGRDAIASDNNGVFMKAWTPLNVFQFYLGRNLISAVIKPRLQRFQNDWDAGLRE